ncbi:hypothetical protein LCGC14_2933410, partial [marine sediment metagenome]
MHGWIEHEPSWFELERKMGENFRCMFYYGPSGHECHFMETETALEAEAVSGTGVRQSFRLPGCPAANTFETGAPFMQRTSVAELVNTAAGNYGWDHLLGVNRYAAEASNAESVAAVGTLRNARGPFDMRWTNVSVLTDNVTVGNWTASGQVADILQ